MFDVFSVLNSKVWRLSEVNIDNGVFKLHYRMSVLLLIASALLIGTRQYFGEPIACLKTHQIDDKEILNYFCWMNGTYTVTERKYDPKYSPRPGEVQHQGFGHDDQTIRHHYYQWVAFVLALQAICFYFPYFLWKMWEAGRLQALSEGLHSILLTDSVKTEKKGVLINYFRHNLHQHRYYFFRFIFCELLNFVNVIVQIYLTDWFLDGRFKNYGPEFLSSPDDDKISAANRVFPKVAQCSWSMGGMSGTPQTTHTLCLLPINIFNEKIYLLLWFWFVLLTIVSGLAIVYSLASAYVPKCRWYMFRVKARLANHVHLKQIHWRAEAGDWFLLSQLSKNVESNLFADFIDELGSRLASEKGNSYLTSEDL